MPENSTSRKRIISLVLLLLCLLSAVAASLLGIDDNPPGVLLALLAALAFVLAFTHPWRKARQFCFLFLASLLGFGLFIVLDIIIGSVVHDSSASHMWKDFLQGTLYESLSLVFTMLSIAAFLIGLVGAIVMWLRSRSHA